MNLKVLKTWMQISGARLEPFWILRQSSLRAIKLKNSFQCEVGLKRGRSAYQTPSSSHLSTVDFCKPVGDSDVGKNMKHKALYD